MSTSWTQEAGMTGNPDVDNVQDLAESASTSATSASNSATSASNSATSAANSATSAASSASGASTSASNASTSASNAASSETSAASSATSATSSKNAAAASATAAAASETAAAASETAAASSETNAASSASSASSSASTATTKASEASTSATNAASSATSASTSASTATTQASNASTSATSAASSASAASTSASNASTSETNAATSASNASTSASNASTSASNASTSETNASNSATSAASSATSAAASYDSFDDRYLGAKSSAPTLDNDGDALLTGALYWNTSSGLLYIWDGSAWDQAAFSTDSAVISFNTRTGAVTLTSSDVNTALGSDAVLDSDIGSTVQAYSSVLQNTTASYTTAEETKLAGIEALADVTDTTNVTAAGALMDSELTSEASVKALNQGVATTDSPSFAGLTVDTNTLYVDSTNNRVGIGTSSPQSRLESTGSIRSTGATDPTSGSSLELSWRGTYADVLSYDRTAGAFEDLQLRGSPIIFGNSGGERMRIDSSGNVAIGASSSNTKLKVVGNLELYNDDTDGYIWFHDYGTRSWSIGSDQSTGSFVVTNTSNISSSEKFVITSAGNVGIGTSSPTTPLYVSGKGTFSGAGSFEALELITSDTNRVYITGNSSVTGDMWRIGTSVSNSSLYLDALQATSQMIFRTGGATERMRIDSSGNVGIGTSSPSSKLTIQNGLYTISAGADSSASTLTDATQKVMRFGVPHYTNAEEDVCLSIVSNTSGENGVLIGGGTGSLNAATRISFHTAANTTTTGGTERMRIDSSGNVGIGTTSPNSACKLDISGGNLRLRSAGSSPTRLQYFNSGGNYTLNVSGGAAIAFHEVSGSQEIGFETHYTGNSHAERMRIDKSGNVGIGTTSPAQKLHVVGDIIATGNVTAYYSDDRLKTNLGKIENALEKVESLEGFYYEANETAQALGYKATKEVGVSAQSVEKIMPEVVAPAPIDEQYLTVRYERLVPLLIESIKELSAEIKKLKGK